ncbi:MAG: tetratricopeptide repeat protein [Thermotoga caldifontis]|uniref:tetratricopeptide repeat protein n=1 Tax=Thermotoga caldifontis TaxID=1508419 RepID=UPI003C7E073C
MKMRLEKFFLVLLTVFALLFLLSFQAFVSMRTQLKRNERIIEAYKLYVNEDYDRFEQYIKVHGLKELENLNSTLKEKVFEKYYSLGVVKLNLGDFSTAYEYFKKAFEQLPEGDERRAELVYLMGQSLAKAGRSLEAKLQLNMVLQMPDSLYRSQAIRLLIDLYRQTGEKEKADELEKTYREVLGR